MPALAAAAQHAQLETKGKQVFVHALVGEDTFDSSYTYLDGQVCVWLCAVCTNSLRYHPLILSNAAQFHFCESCEVVQARVVQAVH